jgi:hypothetical protein
LQLTNDLVTVRMKRPGARWKHTTGDEVLQLRAPQLSDRWTPAVQRATAYYAIDAVDVRWDNRPDTNAGYPRIGDVLGATTPTAILDIPPMALGYLEVLG